MQNWPSPQTIKQLRGFLGLTGYYRRFIKNYAIISQPLTALLKKNAYKWSNVAEEAFNQLKQAMIKAPVLGLPDFEQEFVIETDASGTGIGAVLCQNGHPLAYLSKTLSLKHQSLSTYEMEFLAVVTALEKWKGYLLDRHFKIRTCHFSLKYLLNQKLTTPFQMKWLLKLLGFDYKIVYKKGSENMVADALSRSDHGGTLLQLAVSIVASDVCDKVKRSWQSDIDVHQLIQSLVDNTYHGNKYTWQDGVLKRKGKVVVGADEELRKQLVNHFHGDAVGGHSGVHVTAKKLGAIFYWKGLKKLVKQWVRDCDMCQRQKPDLSAYPGLIQPLPIPERIWTEVSMDFIEKLPMSNGKSVIMVIVDRLSKYAHFMALSHPFTASQVAQVFLDGVYRLHGLPQSIVSDRDKIFISNFWKSLFSELKVKLKLSTAYHPQTDGQTEVVNRCLGCYLRCMCGDKPKEWVKWLPLAEFWYNTNFHSAIQTTPYEVVYCQTPPIHIPYVAGESKVENVDRTLQSREEAIQMLKFHLKRC